MRKKAEVYPKPTTQILQQKKKKVMFLMVNGGEHYVGFRAEMPLRLNGHCTLTPLLIT